MSGALAGLTRYFGFYNLGSGAVEAVANDVAGQATLITRLTGQNVVLVAMEASGGYELEAASGT